MARTRDRLESFTRGYCHAMLWANTYDADTGESDEIYPELWQTPGAYWQLEAFTREAQETITTECADFLVANLRDLMAYARAYAPAGGYDVWECAGHDFALTRNGHGAGFWDRGLGELGERLTDAAKIYGEQSGAVAMADRGARVEIL